MVDRAPAFRAVTRPRGEGGGGSENRRPREITVVLSIELGDHVYSAAKTCGVEVTTPGSPKPTALTLGRRPDHRGTVQIRGRTRPCRGAESCAWTAAWCASAVMTRRSGARCRCHLRGE